MTYYTVRYLPEETDCAECGMPLEVGDRVYCTDEDTSDGILTCGPGCYRVALDRVSLRAEYPS